jgi:hypothetical protein
VTITTSRAGERADPGVALALTPDLRQASRRSIPWIVLAVIAIGVALIGIAFSGGAGSFGVPLDTENAGPVGSRAVAQVLRQQGVTVTPAYSLDQLRDLATGDSTVLVYDPDGNLDRGGFDVVLETADTVVVVEPGYDALQQLVPGVRAAGRPAGTGTVTAGCTLPAAVAAGRIDPHATGNAADVSVSGTFRVASGDATGCFRNGDGQLSLVHETVGGSDVALLGSASILMNDGVDRSGNAALALNLLGEHRTLVWYLPGLADRPASGSPDLSQLTPGWVTPVMILLVLVFIAAAFWRGRRFGPLVVENLPVVVRAGETREGRARLYQRSSSRSRAADALRIGAIGRLATIAGLPQSATAGEIADAVASLTARDRSRLRALLIDDIPATDRELIALSDALAELEWAATAAVSPTEHGPTGRMDA